MMVSDSEPNSELVYIIGSILAGIYRIIAEISSAQLREILSGLRRCKGPPQRGQQT